MGSPYGVTSGDVTIDFGDDTEPWAGQVCGSPAPACPPDQGFVGGASGFVGKTVTIWASNCFAPDPNTGHVDLTGGWDNPLHPLSCGLSDVGPALPPGGVCKPNYSGIKNCYMLYNASTNKCTSCPGTTRTANNDCTKFLHQFPVVSIYYGYLSMTLASQFNTKEVGMLRHEKSGVAQLLVLLSILAIAYPALAFAQNIQSDSGAFLVILNEGETDISSRGVNLHECALILPDGRFHLEQRVQHLPNSNANLKVFESSLDSAQFRKLQEILNDETVKELPPLTSPATPMAVTKFRGFTARIARGEQVQSVGYLEAQQQTVEKSTDLAHSDMKKGWEQSKVALRPLLQWFQALQGVNREPSRGKSTLCSIDSEQ